MRRRYILSLLVVCFCTAFRFTATAQYNAFREYVEPDGWAIGMNLGISDLWGDVGTKSFITHYTNSKYFDKVATMGGLFGRYSIHPCLAIRLQANYGTLYATDKWNYDAATSVQLQGEDPYQRYARAQNAKVYLFEGTFLFEFIPMRMNPQSYRAVKRKQPYIALGFSYFHFNTYSTVGDGGRWVPIRELHLEGQGWGPDYPKQYKTWQPAIPIAIGYKFDIGEHLNIGIEYMYRKTFTDYLDGVSGKYVDPKEYQMHLSPKDAANATYVADKGYYLGLQQPNAKGNMRGNPSNKDAYSTFGITLYYKIPTRTPKWWSL